MSKRKLPSYTEEFRQSSEKLAYESDHHSSDACLAFANELGLKGRGAITWCVKSDFTMRAFLYFRTAAITAVATMMAFRAAT